jgi:hypothetical protein
MKRVVRIMERGMTKFAVCERCNSHFESKRLNRSDAEREIREKFEAHHCKVLAAASESLKC